MKLAKTPKSAQLVDEVARGEAAAAPVTDAAAHVVDPAAAVLVAVGVGDVSPRDVSDVSLSSFVLPFTAPQHLPTLPRPA